MFDLLMKARWKLLLLVPLFAVSACATQPGDFSGRSKTTILVMGEDADPTTLPRSSDVHKRVMAGMQSSLSRQGFRMLDENFVESELGWRFHDRQSKSDLIEAAKLMRNSGNASTRPRVLVLYRIHSRHRDNGFATVVRTRVAGEVYDILANRFLDSFELPVAEYPAPADCNQVCMSETVGRKSREIASRLGDILGHKLAAYSPSGSDQDSREKPDIFAKKGSYSLTIAGFNTEESLEIMRVMSHEFPGYREHDLISRKQSVRHYRYETKANRAKLEKWLNILMLDMGYNPDSDVAITVRGNQLTLDKNQKTDPYSRPPKRGSGRFQ